MSLRTKCAVLLIAFELTLTATLILSVRYIGGYFDTAAQSFSRSGAGMADIARLRAVTRSQLAQLLRSMPRPSDGDRQRMNRRVEMAAQALRHDLGGSWPAGRQLDEFEVLVDSAQRSTGEFLSAATDAKDSAGRHFDPGAHLALDNFLSGMELAMLDEVRESVERSFVAHKRATLILSANMLVGAALGICGLFLVRRWVLLPLQELRRATDEIGRGNLDHRARVSSRDELGHLAAAVNKMSEDLARIQQRMVQRERIVAKGELMAYVAHNIRNPLAGIRGLADACRRRLEPGSPLKGQHEEIVAAIDRFERWLREVEHACTPLEIHAEPIDLREIVSNVIAVFRPMAQRRRVSIEALNGNGPHVVPVDARHFEQALAAVVGNAVEAAGEGGRVNIRIEETPERSQWCVCVGDNGPGISPELSQKVFEPSFTTKRTGHGLGLALARRVAELHGGQLSYERPPGGETTFRFQMPAQLARLGRTNS